jgi:hypothetical protein
VHNRSSAIIISIISQYHGYGMGCSCVGKLWFWLLLFVVSSMTVSLILVTSTQYNVDPAREWMLVGGVTATSAVVRVALSSPPTLWVSTQAHSSNPMLLVQLDDTVNNNSSTVIICRDETELYDMFAIQLSRLQPQTRYYHGHKNDNNNNRLKGHFRMAASGAFNFSILAA